MPQKTFPVHSADTFDNMFVFFQISTSSLGKKYIMAGTGLLLGCFLSIHAVGNSFIFQGGAAFNAYAEHLHSLGSLVPISEVLLLTVFLIHIIVGIMLSLGDQDAGGGRYAVSKSAGGRSWGSRTMPWTGAVIFAFILLHLFNVRFVAHTVSVADTVSAVLGIPCYSLLYSLGIAALFLHISHGFWSLFQSMGLNHPLYNALIRGGSYLMSVLISSVFVGVIFWVCCVR
jgi:succinate dehydrogenase / fumarate reductase cytochrome b subunit